MKFEFEEIDYRNVFIRLNQIAARNTIPGNFYHFELLTWEPPVLRLVHVRRLTADGYGHPQRWCHDAPRYIYLPRYIGRYVLMYVGAIRPLPWWPKRLGTIPLSCSFSL